MGQLLGSAQATVARCLTMFERRHAGFPSIMGDSRSPGATRALTISLLVARDWSIYR
jgi:hypothetical protein